MCPQCSLKRGLCFCCSDAAVFQARIASVCQANRVNESACVRCHPLVVCVFPIAATRLEHFVSGPSPFSVSAVMCKRFLLWQSLR